MSEDANKQAKKSLWGKLGNKFTAPIPKSIPDAAYFDALEEQLIISDMGAQLAITLVDVLRKSKFPSENPDIFIRQAMKTHLLKLMQPADKPFSLPAKDKQTTPCIIMISGVNGTGKTTLIGKLTHFLMAQDYKVALIAGDTFRAGATEQLRIWAQRSNADFFPNDSIKATDPAALAYKVIEYQLNADMSDRADIIIMDTSGRLHNHEDLMQELQKTTRVMQKLVPEAPYNAPHQSLLVLDATTGQNALRQAEQFKKDIGITGLIVNKMDGTAKGGMIPSLMYYTHLPVYFLGIGEKIDDLLPFNANDYLASLLGINEYPQNE